MTCDPTNVPAPDEVDIPSLKNMYREERDRRLRLDGQEQYAAAFEDPEAVDYSDPHMARVSRQCVKDVVDVVVLGGGWAGVLAGYHLRQAGVTDFRIIEQAGDFGGVWYWNRYPGLSCDNDSIVIFRFWRRCSFTPEEVRRRHRDPRVLPTRRQIVRPVSRCAVPHVRHRDALGRVNQPLARRDRSRR